MLKLFVKDFKEINTGLKGLYLTVIIASLLVLISGNYKDYLDIFAAIFIIGMGVSTIGMIICFILPFVRFCMCCDSIFDGKIEKKKYDARVLVTIATIALSLLVIGISFVNTYSNHTVFKFIVDLIDDHTLTKNFSTFGVELSVRMLFIYLAYLTGTIIGERAEKDKHIKSMLSSIIIIVGFHFLVKYAVLLIDFERKFVLMIISYIISCFIIFLIGRYLYKITKNNKNVK